MPIQQQKGKCNRTMIIYGNGWIAKREKKDRKDCRKWEIGFKTDHGTKTRRFAGTWTQAQRARDAFRKELESTPASDATFEERANLFMDRREHGPKRLDRETLDKDWRLVRILVREFGDEKIAEIGRARAVDGLQSIKMANGYGNTYMQAIWVKAKAIFREAAKDEVISRNPIEYEPLPQKDETGRRALTDLEFSRFVDILNAQPLTGWTIAVRLAVFLGLRRGEITGLVWDDVDERARKIYVHRQFTERSKKKQPKGRRSRYVPFSRDFGRLLTVWQREQAAMLSEYGVKQTLATPVMSTDMGTHRNPQSLDRWWRSHRDDYGLPGIVLHELRHTFLTLLGNSGAPGKTLQTVAGWSSLAMADTYVHDMDAINAAAVDSLWASTIMAPVMADDLADTKKPGPASA